MKLVKGLERNQNVDIRRMAAPYVEEILDKMAAMARDGDTAAAKLVMSYAAPPAVGEFVDISGFALCDLKDTQSEIRAALANKAITVEQATQLQQLVTTQVNTQERQLLTNLLTSIRNGADPLALIDQLLAQQDIANG